MKEQVIAYEIVLEAPSAGLVVTWPTSGSDHLDIEQCR
jgi:hypothetical protein